MSSSSLLEKQLVHQWPGRTTPDQRMLSKSLGKQLVYHTIQDPKDAASLEELADMDKEIASLRESIATTKANEKLLKANLAAVNAMTSTDELRSQIIALELEKNEILGRLVQLRSGSVKPVSTEAKEEAEKTWRLWSKKAASRKRICLDVWSYCTEELPEGQTKEDLWVRELSDILIYGSADAASTGGAGSGRRRVIDLNDLRRACICSRIKVNRYW